MARWKYKTEPVTVDENTLTVRGLTAGERVKFLDHQKAAKANPTGNDVLSASRMLAKCGVMEPLSDEDLESIPGDFLTAVVEKIMELSGIKADDEKKAGDQPTQH